MAAVENEKNSLVVIHLNNCVKLLFSIAFFICITSTHAAENYSLTYSTYLGTRQTSYEYVHITTDSQNNIYIAGSAHNTSTLPTVPGGYGDVNNLSTQGFIFKFSPDKTLLYSAFLEDATITGIDVDASGRAYLIGSHSGIGSSAYCQNWGKFIMRLSSDGSAIDFCRQYLPANSAEPPRGITLDSNGDIYIIGTYAGTHVPVTAGAIQSIPAGKDDVYVLKFSGDGSTILTGFYFGGTENEVATSIAVDSIGQIYIAGYTYSADFPSQNTFSGERDAFFSKISNDGTNVIFSGLYGGGGVDLFLDMEIDDTDNAYLAGSTSSTDFPVTINAVQKSNGGEYDTIFLKIDNTNQIVYSSYLGGLGISNAQAIDIDTQGNIYLTGITGDPYFPVTTNALIEVYPQTVRNSYFTKISADGSSILYSTFLGSNVNSIGNGDAALSGGFTLELDTAGKVLIGGFTSSKDFPVSGNAYQKSLIGTSDYFISEFGISPLVITSPLLIGDLILGQSHSFNLTVTGGTPPYSWSTESKYVPVGLTLYEDGNLGGAPNTMSYGGKLYSYLQDNLGIYFLPIVFSVQDQNGNVAHKELFLEHIDLPTANAGYDKAVYTGAYVSLDGSSSHSFHGISQYSWRQVSGSPVELLRTTGEILAFQAPEQSGTLVFELTITDIRGYSATDTVEVTVQALNSTAGTGGGGCTINPRGNIQFDPVLPLLVVLSIFYFFFPRTQWLANS